MSAAAAGSRDLRSAGERIEGLLASFAGGGPVVQGRAEELVRIVAELYGAGLQRVLEICDDAGVLESPLLDQFADDELVAGLLLVHGLHPHGLESRIERALERVRPYLGSHGGDVELLGVTETGVVRLRLVGSCHGCPSSSVTLKLAVEGAIEAAAPEVTGIECSDLPEPASAEVDPALIPVDALLRRTRPATVDAGPTVWEPLAETELAAGEVRPVMVGGVDVVVCRVGSTSYAYRDRCPACAGGLGGASLQRVPGGPIGSAVLTCAGCRTHYDVRLAGASLDRPGQHLEPLPLLERDGSIEIALPRAVPA